MMIKQLFTDHPASVGETYTEHLCFATNTGGRMILAGLACALHGLFPFAFKTTGSRAIVALHEKVSEGARAAIAEQHREDLSRVASQTEGVAAGD